MFRHVPALAANPVSVSGSNLTWVIIVAVVALLALGVAGVLVKEVLAADQGTRRMQEIAEGREGGAARTRTVSSARWLFVRHRLRSSCWCCWSITVASRSNWAGACSSSSAWCSSAAVGYIGMTLATQANVRVAAAARGGGRERGFHVAFRTGGIVGMLTVGLGLLGASVVLLTYNLMSLTVLEGFGFGGALLRCSCVGGGIFTKAADVGATWSARSRPAFPRTTRATPRPSPTTSVTTSATVP